MCFKKISIKSFKGVSKMFQGSFVLPFCFHLMYLIAATRPEGGLVSSERQPDSIRGPVRPSACPPVCQFQLDTILSLDVVARRPPPWSHFSSICVSIAFFGLSVSLILYISFSYSSLKIFHLFLFAGLFSKIKKKRFA